MTPVDLTRIKLGPGAQILEDAPENRELLAQIQHTEPANAPDLLKLALFYRAYSTNGPLSEHLAGRALRQVIGLSSVREAMKAALFDEAIDVGEDIWFGYDPNDREDRDQPQYIRFTQTVLWILFSDIGLVIERYTSFSPTGEEEITHYYVIGVSPNPADLTFKALTQRNL